MTSSNPRRVGQSELGAFLASCRGAFLGIGLMTAMINVLYLTGSFFMLEIYDRVIPSRSIPTLIGLCVLALALYAFQGALDLIRGRVLVRIGAALDHALSGRVFGLVVRLPLHARNQGDGQQPLRDLDQIRGFLAGAGPGRLLRPALDAALCRHLLSLPSLDRLRRARRRGAAGRRSPCSPTGSPAPPPRAPSRMLRPATCWPKPAGATPRSCTPWAWPGA